MAFVQILTVSLAVLLLRHVNADSSQKHLQPELNSRIWTRVVPAGGNVVVGRSDNVYIYDEDRIEISLLELREVDAQGKVVDGRLFPLSSVQAYIGFTHLYTAYMNATTVRIPFEMFLMFPDDNEKYLGRLQVIVYLFREPTTINLGFNSKEINFIEPGNVRVVYKISGWSFCKPCKNGEIGENLELDLLILGRRQATLGQVPNGFGQKRKSLDLGNGRVIFSSLVLVEQNLPVRQSTDQNQGVDTRFGQQWVDLQENDFKIQQLDRSRTKVTVRLPKFYYDVTYDPIIVLFNASHRVLASSGLMALLLVVCLLL